ncbi:hypothetical protein Tco_0850826 [Tanacetum coccineum]
MTTFAEHMIVAGAENRPPMLDKSMYNSWQSHMLLYIKGKKNGRMMLESIENGPLVYLTIKKYGVIRPKKYAELTEQEKLQDDYDVQAINIILQGLPPDVYSLINHCQTAKEIRDRVNLLMQGTELSYQECESSPGDNPIACLNKVMAFMSTVVTSCFPSTNNQLRTSSNLRNQAIIQDGRVVVQQVQRRLGQTFAGTGTKGNATSSGGKQFLDEEQLAFLAYLWIPDGQAIQTTIPQNVAFHTDDLDAYDSDFDDISSAKVVLMANLSSYGSDIFSEYLQQTQNTIVQDTNSSAQQDAMIMSVFEQMSNQTEQLAITQTSIEIKVPKELPKKYFDIQNKELSLDNDRLLGHIICQDVMNIVMHVNSVPVNVLSANHKCLVDGNLESERLKQENDHLFELLLSQGIVQICVNSLATLTNYSKLEQDYIDEKQSFNNQNAPEILEFFKINEWQAKLDAKDVSIANLKKHIESLKGKNVVEKHVTPNKAKVIALGMFKLDLEPLAPKVLNNRDAHMDYIKHSREHADTLQEIVEHARALRPLDGDLDFAC